MFFHSLRSCHIHKHCELQSLSIFLKTYARNQFDLNLFVTDCSVSILPKISSDGFSSRVGLFVPEEDQLCSKAAIIITTTFHLTIIKVLGWIWSTDQRFYFRSKNLQTLCSRSAYSILTNTDMEVEKVFHLFDGNFHTTYEVSSSWRVFFNVVSPSRPNPRVGEND